jgi:3-hydroxyacyl-CoA dehydrogenase
MLKTQPAPFISKRAARLVTCGNLEDHLERLAEADWIVEAVVENLEIKRGLYERVEAVRKKGSIVSSNTSTIPLIKLVEGLPARFAKDFLITHFFNPPRYMRLLEVVAGAATRADARTAIRDFADRRLGKGVVDCHDRPGFIANRIGIFWMQCGVVAAQDHGVTVEEADAVLSRPVGIPKTGLFGLLDLVGLDLHPKVDASMAALLAEGDAYHGWRRPWPLRAGPQGGAGKPGRRQARRAQGAGRTSGPRRAVCLDRAIPHAGLCRLPGARGG